MTRPVRHQRADTEEYNNPILRAVHAPIADDERRAQPYTIVLTYHIEAESQQEISELLAQMVNENPYLAHYSQQTGHVKPHQVATAFNHTLHWAMVVALITGIILMVIGGLHLAVY